MKLKLPLLLLLAECMGRQGFCWQAGQVEEVEVEVEVVEVLGQQLLVVGFVILAWAFRERQGKGAQTQLSLSSDSAQPQPPSH
ncbi:hypothetical protein IAQ61_000092 [Plenodomus lingam]|uniref:uncharacterized protein n=1 Tax=Leptosphaeria maculans TaxID=5022 RepID=UPI0033263147|nr:hypothetical protein IAQ61_000092 [Plenodomus lingam]